MLGFAGAVIVPTAANAAAGDPFDPTDPTVYISQTATTQLYRSLTNPDGSFSFSPEGAAQDLTYNAIGFDSSSNYIYGIATAGNAGIPSGSVIRIGQEGSVSRVGNSTYTGPSGSTNFQAGAVGDDGFYYIIQQGTEVAYRIDLTDGSPAGTVLLDGAFASPDFTFADGYAWSLTAAGALVRLDMSTGELTTLDQVVTGASGAGFGAAWTFGNGNLGFSDNVTGAVYQLSVTDEGSAEPAVALVSVSSGPASTTNDGTAVPGLPVDLAVEKTTAATHLPDGRVEYSISVRNLSDTASSGWSVVDALPEGLVDPAVVEELTNSYDPATRTLTVTGGRLEAGASFTFTVVALSEVADDTCVVNTATVVGNELDDNEANDTSEAETCAVIPPTDFGDAPESYGTLVTDDGARHIIPDYDATTLTAPVMLGESIDAEDDGQPSAAAGDDGADEDGVAFNSALGYENNVIRTGVDPNSLSGIENTLEVTASADGFVSVWVDWNQDGDFDDDDERVASSQAVTAGTNDVTFDQAENPADNASYVRVRYSTDASAIATPTGAAPDGEVEDYPVLFERILAPNSCTVSDIEHYAFTFGDPTERTGDGGAGTTALFSDVSVIGGQSIDMLVEVLAGQTHAIRRGQGGIFGTDDANWQIERDATLRYSFFAAGTDNPVDVNTAFTVSDMDTGEIATFAADDLASYAVTAGSAVRITETTSDEVQFQGFGQWNGDPQSRFQFVLEGISTFESRWQGGSNSGFGFDGDGDFAIQPSCFDFGDAPESYGTSLAADGARHLLTPGLVLGERIDFDPDGQPSNDALGDDENRAADEDGVTDEIVVTTGDESIVSVSVTNDTDAAATLAGWVDLDGSGTFDDGELVTVEVPANSGTAAYDLTFAAATTADDTFARFRLFPAGVTTFAPTGEAAGGEVEDYTVSVLDRDITIDKDSDFTENSRPGDTITYTVTATNTGTDAYTADEPAVVFDDLSGVLDDATYNDDAEAVASDEAEIPAPAFLEPSHLSWAGALAGGESVTITYTVTLGDAGDRTVRNVAWHSEETPGDEPPETPVCEPGDDDCITITNLLPELVMEKSADFTELPRVGETVTYTVTATNIGPGVYTDEAPAVVLDDMSDVLDDGEFVDGSITTSLGEDAAFEDGRLSWSGAMDVDETVTITYQVTYTAAGDAFLSNVAWQPSDPENPGDTPVCDPRDADGRDPVTGEPCGFVQIPGGQYNVTKDVDPEDGSTVVAGQELTYTITFNSTGTAPADIESWTDDLSSVLDDAEIISAPAASNPDVLTVSEIEDGQFSVSGESVPQGESFTVSYTVRVLPDGERGDNTLGNVVFPENTPPGEDEVCEDDDPLCTVNYVPEIIDSKSVNPEDGSTVQPGAELTYTLEFENIGTGAGSVDRVDDLTHVLDDADVTVAPVASNEALAVSEIEDNRFSITGDLEAGQTVTVTYTVTVKSVDNLGDTRLGNFLLNPDEVPPAELEECVPGENEDATCNSISRIIDSKSVNPESGSVVEPGQALTYTLSFENTGTGSGEVDRVDDLTHVLDDADVTVQPTASDDALTVSKIEDGRFSITGELAPGESAMVTYTVTVKAAADMGDTVLGNFLLDPDEDTPEDPTVCEPGDEDCTTNLVPRLEDSKTVNPETGTEVEPGQELTYTLEFESTGSAPVDVDRVDDLTHVLDDADVTVAPAASDEALAVSEIADGRFSITGSLEPGQAVTVTYTVKVKAADQLGDTVLANFLMGPGGETPEDPTVCEPGDEDCTTNTIPNIIDSKSVNPESGAAAQPGQALTYTLTFENIGSAADDVDRVDDLTHVLDDADVTVQPTASDDALDVSKIEDNRFSINGTLEPGQKVTVTYTVTVKATNELGDAQLANFLLDPEDETPEDPSECAEGSEDCTSNPVPKIVDSKTVDPSSNTSVKAGQELTYTLTFTNDGNAAGDVNRVDDLTHVLDDADVTMAPVASDEALTVSAIENNRFAVTGTLEPGQTVTVSYTVTVKSADQMGDSQVANFLLDPEEEPPAEPVCTEGEDCTFNPVSDVTVTKTADPANGTEVEDGQVVTYTLTFQNDGEGSEEISYTDHMAGVLDDADLVEAPQASDEALSASAVEDGMFTVTGELAGGQTVIVTYSVQVRDYDEQGDHSLGNVVTVTGQDPAAACAEGDLLCTTHPVEAPEEAPGTPEAPGAPEEPGTPAAPGAPGAEDPLAPTGGEIALGGFALLLLLAGLAGVLIARRRKEAIES